jgi:hypothetical protein
MANLKPSDCAANEKKGQNMSFSSKNKQNNRLETYFKIGSYFFFILPYLYTLESKLILAKEKKGLART